MPNHFSEGGHVAYEIKRKEVYRSVEHYVSEMFVLMHTPNLSDG